MRRQTKTRQFYGFVGETDYDEEFLAELEMDFEERSGLKPLHAGYRYNIMIMSDNRIIIDPKIAHGRPVIKGGSKDPPGSSGQKHVD